MTSDLKIFFDITEHRRPEKILYYAKFTDHLRQKVIERIGTDDLNSYFGFFEPVDIKPEKLVNAKPVDYSSYWQEDIPKGTVINNYGVAEVPSGFYHFWGYISPLRNAMSLSEIENYPLESFSDLNMSDMSEQVRKANVAGRVARGIVGHMYETAWQIRGYEQFLMDLVERPAWAQCILEKLAEQNRHKAIAFAEAGVNLLHCGDDVANQNSLMFNYVMWDKYINSHWKEIWSEVYQINPEVKIWYHSDGNVSDIISRLIESGIDILNPLQPECLDLDLIYNKYHGKLCFDGCIGTQTTMPFGTAKDVKQNVKEIINKYGLNGGLIVSPTHVLEPDVPFENIEAFAETCRNYL